MHCNNFSMGLFTNYVTLWYANLISSLYLVNHQLNALQRVRGGRGETAEGRRPRGDGRGDTAEGTRPRGYGREDTAEGTRPRGYGRGDTALSRAGTDVSPR